MKKDLSGIKGGCYAPCLRFTSGARLERFPKLISGMERGSFGAGLRCRTQTRSLRILPAFSASPCTKTSLAIREISFENRSSHCVRRAHKLDSRIFSTDSPYQNTARQKRKWKVFANGHMTDCHVHIAPDGFSYHGTFRLRRSYFQTGFARG